MVSGPQTPAFGGSGAAWGIRLAAAVLVLLGVGIGWALNGGTGSPFSHTPDPGDARRTLSYT